MRLRAVEDLASTRLAIELAITIADREAPVRSLSLDERKTLDGFCFERRRSAWLVGRRAMKELLASLGRDDDTSTLLFPEAKISLTHADRDIAIAAGTRGPCSGIGVDYETVRPVNTSVARWFLTDRELGWLHSRPRAQQQDHIIRLWTIKEAAYKSLPGNRGYGLQDVEIRDLESPCSGARMLGTAVNTVTRRFASGFLTIAVNKELS